MAIHYFETSVKSGLKDKRKLSAFLKALITKHLDVKAIELNYIFCNDDYLLEKNQQFLNHDTLTDIITFDLSPSEVETWVDDAKRGMENALRANPLDIKEQYERQIKDLQEAYGEAMLELRARKKLQSLLGEDEK